MDKEWSKRFAGFEEVWKRVTKERPENPSCPCRVPEGVELMPKKNKKSAAVRFCPKG